MTTQRMDHPESGGTPLVMIHGVGSSAGAWDPVVALLPPDRPMLRYTLRGHEARGENPAPPYEMSDFVSDLVAMLDAHGFERVVLAGFSLGGLIAQAATLAHPVRVAGLVLVGSVAGRTPEERDRVLERYRTVAAEGPRAVAEVSVARWYTPGYLATHPEAESETLRRMAELDPDCYAAAYRVLATSDLVDELHRIEVPVLAIAGQDDVGSPPHMSRRIAERVAAGSVIVVPHVKHQLLQETPDIIAKEIDRFVEDNQL